MKENIFNSLQQNCQEAVTAGHSRHPLVISGRSQLGHKLREKATMQPLPLLSVQVMQPEWVFFPKDLQILIIDSKFSETLF